MRRVAILSVLLIAACRGAQQQPARNEAPPAAAAAPVAVTAVSDRMVVYKTPTCGCCGAWVDSLRANGFTLEVHDLPDLTEIKRTAGVSDAHASCHTGQIGGYVIEGHVPVADIRRLLREKPAITGLAVPGMIAGTLGMEQGNARPPYDVVAIGRDGSSSVYQRH